MILAVSGDVERPDPPRNGYDEAALLARRGIRVVLEAERWRETGRRGGVAGVLDRVRSASIDAYDAAGHDDAGALLGGLVLGADEDLSKAARDDFRTSGLAHLLAVSGSNVALLAVLVLVLAWVVGLGRAPAVGATILVIAGYVGVVGPSPSVVRAGVAGALAAAAWLLSRPVDRWHLYAVGLAVLLGRNPWDALDPGFQLSFAAVAAIYVLVPRLTGWLEGTPLPLILVVPVSISAACTLVTAPIAYLHFGQANVVASVPANVLAAPSVPPILWLGVLAAALDPFLPVASDGCAALARYPCLYLLEIARLGAWLDARLAPHALPLVLVTGAAALGWAALRGGGGKHCRAGAGGRRPPTHQTVDEFYPGTRRLTCGSACDAMSHGRWLTKVLSCKCRGR